MSKFVFLFVIDVWFGDGVDWLFCWLVFNNFFNNGDRENFKKVIISSIIIVIKKLWFFFIIGLNFFYLNIGFSFI